MVWDLWPMDSKFRGVVHSQIKCTDFKSSTKKKSLDDFSDFSNFLFLVHEDFINKIGFKHRIWGIVHSQVRYTDFKCSKKSLDFLYFSDFLRGVRGFFWVNNPSVNLCCYFYFVYNDSKFLQNVSACHLIYLVIFILWKCGKGFLRAGFEPATYG